MHELAEIFLTAGRIRECCSDSIGNLLTLVITETKYKMPVLRIAMAFSTKVTQTLDVENLSTMKKIQRK